MLKTVFLTLVTLLVALGGGAASVWLAVDADVPLGSVSIGDWTAYPDLGTPAADPYSRARFARKGELALGIAEGITFATRRDSSGQALRPDCDYRIEGVFPAARLWTLHARDDETGRILRKDSRAPALHSNALLRQPGGLIAIAVSRHPLSGNWLAIDGDASFQLVLTLYDTAISSSARIAEVELPQVLRTGCDA